MSPDFFLQWTGVTTLIFPRIKSCKFPVEKRKKGKKIFLQWTQPEPGSVNWSASKTCNWTRFSCLVASIGWELNLVQYFWQEREYLNRNQYTFLCPTDITFRPSDVIWPGLAASCPQKRPNWTWFRFYVRLLGKASRQLPGDFGWTDLGPVLLAGVMPPLLFWPS